MSGDAAAGEELEKVLAREQGELAVAAAHALAATGPAAKPFHRHRPGRPVVHDTDRERAAAKCARDAPLEELLRDLGSLPHLENWETLSQISR